MTLCFRLGIAIWEYGGRKHFVSPIIMLVDNMLMVIMISGQMCNMYTTIHSYVHAWNCACMLLYFNILYFNLSHLFIDLTIETLLVKITNLCIHLQLL